MKPFILASASPRRREICSLLGFSFEILPARKELPADPSLPLEEAIRLVAKGKAEEIAALHPDRFVLGADTSVILDGCILNKPTDEADACRMLGLLSDREHLVYTGVWLCGPGVSQGFTDIAAVRFFPLTQEEIRAYVATGEPMDKAGAYGIQGKGIMLVQGIRGDFYTVMGLPGGRLYRFLKEYL